MFEKSSEHLQNSLIMLEIGWKSFGNRWPVLKSSKSFYTFGYLRKSSGNLRHFSEKFRNLRKSSENLWKFRFCGDEKSHALKKSWRVYQTNPDLTGLELFSYSNTFFCSNKFASPLARRVSENALQIRLH